MARIRFEGRCHDLAEGETVLEGLLGAGVSLPYACRNGVCHTCKMRATEGTPPPHAQRGLKETEIAQGLFLPCVCRPEEDLDIARPGGESDPFVEATVVGKERLGEAIVRLRLQTPHPIVYRAGQFLNLRAGDGSVRSYSLASVPGLEDVLELHVRRLADGRVSRWIHETVGSGDTLHIQGPIGNCFYAPGDPDTPLVLIGTGSGLAPLWGIVRDALRQGHRAPIWLYHGARQGDGLYLDSELRELARNHDHLHYVPCISGPEVPSDCRAGRSADIALADHPRLKGWRAYLCGHPGMVEETRRRIFLAGARISDIHADAFTLTPPAAGEGPAPIRTAT